MRIEIELNEEKVKFQKELEAFENQLRDSQVGLKKHLFHCFSRQSFFKLKQF